MPTQTARRLDARRLADQLDVDAGPAASVAGTAARAVPSRTPSARRAASSGRGLHAMLNRIHAAKGVPDAGGND